MSYDLLKTGLLLHMAGLSMIVGATLIGYIVVGYFRRVYAEGDADAGSIMRIMPRFSYLTGVGVGLLIVSGFAMMYATAWVYATQLWFHLKMPAVLLVIILGEIVNRPQRKKLFALIADPESRISARETILRLGGRIRGFYLTQLAILLVIIVLSSYRFS
jgi:uncharacterized membrane protein SirB2